MPDPSSRPVGGTGTGQSPCGWSHTAMTEAVQRLAKSEAANVAQALAAVSEAVWWITVTDASLARRSPHAYDTALGALDPAARQATQYLLAGLRFVRNQAGYRADPADFVHPRPGPGPGSGENVPPAAWTWHTAPHMAAVVTGQRARERPPSLYREYRAHLAGRLVTETITQATAFLTRVYETARHH